MRLSALLTVLAVVGGGAYGLRRGEPCIGVEGSPGAPLAFPGAMGGGANAVGGRGGTIMYVTNLNNSGTGSLRACVEAPGPRTCIFRVAGTIPLTSTLTVTNPYLTVAGQSAPGGILVQGKAACMDLIRINTHDVVWRYTRLHKGFKSACAEGPGSNIQVGSGAYNVVVDHNSIFWTQDGNFDASTGVTATTVSYNIISEPLDPHPFMMLISGSSPSNSDASNLDYHHNFFSTFSQRCPATRIGKMRFVNNMIYNWASVSFCSDGGGDYDIIGNYWKRGPLSPSPGASRGVYELDIKTSAGTALASPGSPTIYVSGNKGPNNATPSNDNWGMVREVTGSSSCGNTEVGPLSTSFRRLSPLANYAGTEIVADSANSLEASLLPVLGPYRYLKCDGTWQANRDTADTRILGDWSDGGGAIISDEATVGGMPTMTSVAACTDTDSDGMPDTWEVANGLNPNNAADRNNTSQGYTMVEWYLAGMNVP